jgi:transcriptional regulator with GAF, ATPase, and Fis domain
MSLHMKQPITLLKQNIWIIGILLGILSWVFDGVIDFMFFNHEPLVETLFIPELNEIWMRTFNFFILVAFGFFVHLAWNRQKKIQQDLEWSQEQGKQLLRQFRAILEGTSQDTGKNFFPSMVKQLAATLNARDAFIGILEDGGTQMKSLAFISGGNFLDTITYELAGTPCEKVLNEAQCIYNGNVQESFPTDDYLKENNIKSYLGYPLTDMNGSPIGIMSVMHTELFADNAKENIEAILRAFAARVEAEMRRIQIENKMKHYAEKLEQSNQDLQDFAYIASHDLKEPIRKIIIFG